MFDPLICTLYNWKYIEGKPICALRKLKILTSAGANMSIFKSANRKFPWSVNGNLGDFLDLICGTATTGDS